MPSNGPQPQQFRFIVGIVLFMLGLVLLLTTLSFSLPDELWKYLPVPFVLLGLFALVRPTRHLDRIGGLWVLTVGVYLIICMFGLFGLTWWTAWPVYIIALGITVMLEHEGCVCTQRRPRSEGDA